MYNENGFITTRDRINEELAQRDITGSQSLPHSNSRINCRGEESAQRMTAPQAAQRGTWGLENHPLASVYSPIQHWRELYEPDEALERGTLFKELDLPFLCGDTNAGGGCCGK